MSEPSEEKQKINFDSKYLDLNLYSLLFQFIFFLALLLTSVVLSIFDLPQNASNPSYFETGFSFMGLGMVIVFIPVLIFALKVGTVKKQEDVEEFTNYVKKFFFDKSAISWVVFISGIVLAILGMV